MAFIEIATTGLSLIKSLFGGGSCQTIDDEARRNQISGWAVQNGLSGANGKFINQNILQSFFSENPNCPSSFSKNNGYYQDDVQQYLAAIGNTLKGIPPGADTIAWIPMVTDYINQVKEQERINQSSNTGGITENDSQDNGIIKTTLAGLSTTSMIVIGIIVIGIVVTIATRGKIFK